MKKTLIKLISTAGLVSLLAVNSLGKDIKEIYDKICNSVQITSVYSLMFPGEIRNKKFFPDSKRLVIVFEENHHSGTGIENTKKSIETLDDIFGFDCIGLEGFDKELDPHYTEKNRMSKSLLDSIKNEETGIKRSRIDSVNFFGIDDRILTDSVVNQIAKYYEYIIKFTKYKDLLNHIFKNDDDCFMCEYHFSLSVKGVNNRKKFIDRDFGDFLNKIIKDQRLFLNYSKNVKDLVYGSSNYTSKVYCFDKIRSIFYTKIDKELISDRRSEIFVEKTINNMVENGFSFGALRVGSDHSKYMCELFEKKKMSYIVIRPEGFWMTDDKTLKNNYLGFGKEISIAMQLLDYAKKINHIEKLEKNNLFYKIYKKIEK